MQAAISSRRGARWKPAGSLERTAPREVRQTGRERGLATTSVGREGNQAGPAYWFTIPVGKLTFQCQAPNNQVAGDKRQGACPPLLTAPEEITN